MKIDKRSLAYRLLVPILAVTAIIMAAILLAVAQIAARVAEDYHHHMMALQTEETNRILDSALTELTTARLLGNPTVVEAKQNALLEALALSWERRGIEGVVAAEDGRVLRTTFPAETTNHILSNTGEDTYILTEGEREIHAQAIIFHPWKWRVVTACQASAHQIERREVFLIAPIVAGGFLLLATALLFILRRQLQRPVEKLAVTMARAESVALCGVSELDTMAKAFNESLETILERNETLADELVERERAEEMIRDREAQIRLLLESTAEGIYGVNTEGICIFANPSCCQLLGYGSPEELLGRHIHSLIHHSRADGNASPEEECRILQTYRTGRGEHVDDEVFWRADGTSFPVEYWAHPIVEDEQVTGAVVGFFDITERKRAEAELLAEKNKFEATIAAMGDGVSIQNRDFTILYQNAVHKGFVGSHIGEKCFSAYEYRDEACEGCPVVLSFDDGAVHLVHRVVQHPEEGVRHFEISASPLRDASGAIVAGIEVVRNITERVKVEEQLHHAQKMESIGHLAGGVAHDFNNVLSVIQGYSELLRFHIGGDETLLEHINQVQAAVRRGSAITRQILAFSRKQSIVIASVDLGELITNIQKMLRRLVREDITMELELPASPLLVAADASQLDQVLLNLASNASHAMPAGGTIRICLSRTRMDERFVSSHGYGSPGEYALLTFSDTGVGMDEQVRRRIFEPFFTTRKPGEGTGLGLAMVYGIITKHNGYITVYSEPGHGTVFKIFLPLRQETIPTEASDPSGEKEGIVGGTETILVAEDDENIRLLSRTVLEMAGYTVIETKDGEEAVQKFAEQKERIDLVLLDGIMPRKNGKQALLAMRAIKPDIRAIILSGYTEEVFAGEDRPTMPATFLQKPIAPDHLLKELRRALDTSAS